jgi:hypothetical protein
LPDDVLIYLLGSRYCDTQKLSDLAWSLFGHVTPGWRRTQAICDYAHERICFGYQHARRDRTAFGRPVRSGLPQDMNKLEGRSRTVPGNQGGLRGLGICPIAPTPF